MSKPPAGNLAIVTGASSGIGLATARLLAQRGFRTILIARRADQLATIALELGRHAPSIALPADLAQSEHVVGLLVAVLQREGTPSVLVNCAGAGKYAPFLEHLPSDMARMHAVNYEAPAALIRAVLPDMLTAARAGRLAHIFNVSSVSARVGPWGHAGYSAAKSALRSLTETLECEHSADGMRFTVVYPGIVKTEFFEKPDMGPLWAQVATRAISSEKVALAMVSILGKRRISLYVPRHYRMLDLISAISPNIGMRLVRRGSEPRGSV